MIILYNHMDWTTRDWTRMLHTECTIPPRVLGFVSQKNSPYSDMAEFQKFRKITSKFIQNDKKLFKFWPKCGLFFQCNSTYQQFNLAKFLAAQKHTGELKIKTSWHHQATKISELNPVPKELKHRCCLFRPKTQNSAHTQHCSRFMKVSG